MIRHLALGLFMLTVSGCAATKDAAKPPTGPRSLCAGSAASPCSPVPLQPLAPEDAAALARGHA